MRILFSAAALTLAWTLPIQAQSFISAGSSGTSSGSTSATTSPGIAGIFGSAMSTKNTPSFFKPALPSSLKLTNFMPSLPNFQNALLMKNSSSNTAQVQITTIQSRPRTMPTGQNSTGSATSATSTSSTSSTSSASTTSSFPWMNWWGSK